VLIGSPPCDRKRFGGLQRPMQVGDARSRGLAFPGNARVEETIWQLTGVEDGEVDDCRWFRKIAMILSRYGFVYFLTIIEMLSRSLAGEWQEKSS